MPRKNVLIALVVVLLMAGIIASLSWLQPRVHFTVKSELVGPDDEAIDLLGKNAPLDEIQSAVQRSGKQVDQIEHLGGTLLYYAVTKHRMDVAKWLLKQGADPNGTYHGFGGVPLEGAISQGDEPMVRLLTQAGADPDLKMGYVATPRGEAEKLGNPAILAALPPKRGPATRALSRPSVTTYHKVE